MENSPSAVQLLSTYGTYFLVYHSKNASFKNFYPCLRALKRSAHEGNHHRATYQFEYVIEGDIRKEEREVKTDKMDEAYPYDNELTVSLQREGTPELQDWQIIYTDYTSCVVFSSWNLGYQVWVKAEYLRMYRGVPKVCALVYELLAWKKKHAVYNWRRCAIEGTNQHPGS
ncbi:uncharacterized protein LOC119384820 [Rhipicephalus sanguineus]|uniref:uncharacterized protein LOC119384820 n=1 Tax=Rhipicephalus sanguineus TaxID=34632 RepID=UPI0018963743|nr:uncharacterized protein LOC119384820 [Rhipicephalus sanguineus]